MWEPVLIRPYPWSVIRVGQNLRKKHEIAGSLWPCRVPVPGWIGLGGESGELCVVDYSASELVPLLNLLKDFAGSAGYDAAFSPDGTLAVIRKAPSLFGSVMSSSWAANPAARAEPRAAWPATASCAAPNVPIRGAPGKVLRLVVDYHAGRKHLPVVELVAA